MQDFDTLRHRVEEAAADENLVFVHTGGTAALFAYQNVLEDSLGQ
jgi:1-aminocyclopropane-1-carboxylate deaminase/D-cysteine desulfhydrase-like pyridoxal-dependent ACC family enzyme